MTAFVVWLINLSINFQRNLRTGRAKKCTFWVSGGQILRISLLGASHGDSFVGLICVPVCPKKLLICHWKLWQLKTDLTLFHPGWGNFALPPEISKKSKKWYFLTFSLYLFWVSLPILTVSPLFEVVMGILLGHPKTVQKSGSFKYSQFFCLLLYEPNGLTMGMTWWCHIMT